MLVLHTMLGLLYPDEYSPKGLDRGRVQFICLDLSDSPIVYSCPLLAGPSFGEQRLVWSLNDTAISSLVLPFL